jgi:hypothetical protein
MKPFALSRLWPLSVWVPLWETLNEASRFGAMRSKSTAKPQVRPDGNFFYGSKVRPLLLPGGELLQDCAGKVMISVRTLEPHQNRPKSLGCPSISPGNQCCFGNFTHPGSWKHIATPTIIIVIFTCHHKICNGTRGAD